MKKLIPLFGLALFCLTIHCGGATDDSSSTEETSTRLVTGSLTSYEYDPMVSALMSKKEDRLADEIIAVDENGTSLEAEVDENGVFSLELPTDNFYVISFAKENGFVATLIFNKLSSPSLPLVKDEAPLDLGEIEVNGVEANCQDEESAICGMDGDKDGVSLCDDDDEKDKNKDSKNKDEDDGAPISTSACDQDHKVKLCHIPQGNPDNSRTLCVDIHAAQYHNHLKHGDSFGECEDDEKVAKDSKDKSGDEEEIEDDADEGQDEKNCDHAAFARFDFAQIKNWNKGNLQAKVYVGGESEPYEDNESFMLIDDDGKTLVDESFVQNVPGLAFKRGNGYIIFSFWGHHPMSQGKEAVKGKLILDGAKIKKVASVSNAPFERQGNGIAVFGQAGEDEFTIMDDYTLDLTSTVTVHRDDLKIEYEMECEE